MLRFQENVPEKWKDGVKDRMNTPIRRLLCLLSLSDIYFIRKV